MYSRLVCFLVQPVKRHPRVCWSVFAMLWLLASVAGAWLLAAYAGSPGASGATPPRWPAGSKVPRAADAATLVLFAHPHCPCTRASLGELERIVARFQGKVEPSVVFFEPEDADDAWSHTDLWKTAEAIPGARVLGDRDGAEARRFGASTSGHAVLYSASGDLLFSGGITMARGHAGDNTGQLAIESCLAGHAPACRETPVFGCPIVAAGTDRKPQ